MKTSFSLLAVMVATGAQLLFASPAAADQFAVNGVRQDAATNQLAVMGTGFRQGASLALNGKILRIVSVQSREIRAELPTMQPGMYRLDIYNPWNDRRSFFVAIDGPNSGSGQGAPGPAGPMGPQGPAGPIGFTGAQGPAGPVGAQGPAGPAGAQGPAGPVGAQGPAGPVGAQGPAGPVGAQGPAGPEGPTGETGATGATGADGQPGIQGAQGVQGPVGPRGGFEVVADNGTTFGALLAFLGQQSLIGVQDNGVWLSATVTSNGLTATSFPSLYADAACTGTAFLPIDSVPAPFFRLLQSLNEGDATAYYAGNPLLVQSFQGMSAVGHPETCETTAGTGWDLPTLAGEQQSFDMTRFPGPYKVKLADQ